MTEEFCKTINHEGGMRVITSAQRNQLSKYLSLVLRHRPDIIGIALDAQGWTPVPRLINALQKAGKPIDEDILKIIVATNDKKRFQVSPDGSNIRACQGHSVNVDLQLKGRKPPDILYHGTSTRYLDSILTEGIKSKNRHHVHLSEGFETALTVGKRHGMPVILKIKAGQMHQNQLPFYRSENGVWLTEFVSPKWIAL